ncbi:hypothetical protein NGA_2086400, partial [Nannochloropsis gaditana CCMP526]
QDMASLKDPKATLHHCRISLHLTSSSKAQLIQDVLEVDEELQPDKVCKSFAVEGSALNVHLVSCDLKVLRVAVSSFYDMLTVALKTLLQFDNENGL